MKNLTKTQFLMPEPGSYGPIKTYHRRSKTMLFKGDIPLRLMEWSEFQDMKKEWPEQVEIDKLSCRVVWVLIPN